MRRVGATERKTIKRPQLQQPKQPRQCGDI